LPLAQVTCAVLHKKSSVLTVGFTNGVFSLYELPSFAAIHSLR
jgi:periodic tryptophan protein 2